jgi:hypothetical protein
MCLVSLLLFWLPILGPFVAGIVGGRRAGSVGNALIAVFAPAVVLAAIGFALTSVLTGLPVIGAIAGMGGLVLLMAQIGPLLVGAILGGAFA